MKRPIIIKRTIYSLLLILVMAGFDAIAQQLPEMTVRFANPRFDCETESYCVDVELQSDTQGLEVFGFNVRFFYDGSILQYLNTGNYQGGYTSPDDPLIFEGFAGSGPYYFAVNDPLKWYNGYVELTDPGAPPVVVSTTEWTLLFSVCFKVINPIYLGVTEFCPPLIWDLQKEIDAEYGEKIGFLPGDDGVSISIVVVFPDISEPTTEDVVQFNWEYGEYLAFPAGAPIPVICVDTTCGYVIPVANWAIFLAIGLMIMASVFIYRRRV
ncbi:MAG: hypothetical protein K0B08_11440 [Bacteroidales bacterium]|nr:hypothetical protein [Bacteroidales bacterium]